MSTGIPMAYLLQSYPSFLRTGAANRRICSSFMDMSSVTEAKIVILHGDVRAVNNWLFAYPDLSRKYLIWYCVWETSSLPHESMAILSRFKEIWTCSTYCRDIISKYHSSVKIVPHVVDRNMKFSVADRNCVEKMVDFSPSRIYFLSMGRLLDPRKNIRQLVDVFQCSLAQMPHATLILKCFPHEEEVLREIESRGQIKVVSSLMSLGEVNSLYDMAHAYVSPHHAEGWGLTISDAILFNKPVVATGYSGNLDYMDERSSALIEFTEKNIEIRDCSGLISSDMKWAYPHSASMFDKLIETYCTIRSGGLLEHTRIARTQLERFSFNSISSIIRRALTDGIQK